MEVAQAFLNATAAVQLATLPQFSNSLKEDKFTPAQWLQKVNSHRVAAGWTDVETITHVCNSFRGQEVLDWFDSLAPLGINTTVWAEIQAAFEFDFKAAPTTTSVVFKIADIKQTEAETVLNYFGRILKTVADLKAKVDPNRFVIPDLVLPADQAAAWTALPNETKALINTHFRTNVASQTMENVFSMLITAGLRPEFRTKVLENNLITMAAIKLQAQTTENLIHEKNFKRNGTVVSEVNEDEEVNAINRGYNNRGNFQNNSRGGFRGQPRGGHQSQQHQQQTQQSSSRGGFQAQGGRGGRGAARGGSGRGRPNPNANAYPPCPECGRTNHSIDNCFDKKRRLEQAEKRKMHTLEQAAQQEETVQNPAPEACNGEEQYYDEDTKHLKFVYFATPAKN